MSSFPRTDAGWEDAYYLPRGIIEAVQTCPSRGRIAELLAQVRDAALEAAGAPVPGRDAPEEDEEFDHPVDTPADYEGDKYLGGDPDA